MSSGKERTVFLDIDGVLAIPCTRYDYFHQPCVERLVRLITETDAWIVVSSTWRKGKTVEELRETFRSGGDRAFMRGYDPKVVDPFPFPSERIIGKTPVSVRSSCDGMPFGRDHEIQMWLEEYKEKIGLERYVVIDDESYDLEEQAEFLVKTDGTDGLQDIDIEKAKEILMRP